MVKYIGQIDREEVNQLYGNSRAGIVVYQPANNHFKAQPIKMFEFMAAGLPVVASNFPLWKEIIDNADCGITVDPTNTQLIKEACETFLNDPELAQEKGQNGRAVVMSKYNWNIEEIKLLELYSSLE